jgi:membrane fusion protein (multidrug efflux system)
VKVGETLGENVIVTEGLKNGDRIVVEGLQKVREGAVVQPMTSAQMGVAAAQAKDAEPKHAEGKHAEPKPAKE